MKPEGLLPCSHWPTVGPILSQVNPIFTPDLLKIALNIILPSTLTPEKSHLLRRDESGCVSFHQKSKCCKVGML